MPDKSAGDQHDPAPGPPAVVESGFTGHGPRDEGGRPAPALRHGLPLLESLVGDHLDPGYRAAAEKAAAEKAAAERAAAERAASEKASADRGATEGDAGSTGPTGPITRGRRPRTLAYLAAGLVVIGLVLGIALTSTKDQSAGTRQARLALLDDIDQAQTSQARLQGEQSVLAAALRSVQASLGVGGQADSARRLGIEGGQTAVVGPGLTVVLDGSKSSPGSGEILDRDIQLLVNGLWSSGAEAIAIGGVRLRVTSSIRQAGSAILVDNRPVFFPLTVQAVGDPSILHVRFVDTVGFGRFQTFVSLYGIRFDITAQTAITLPPAGAPDLRFASAVATTGTSPDTGSVEGPSGAGPPDGSPSSTNPGHPPTAPARKNGTDRGTPAATGDAPLTSSR